MYIQAIEGGPGGVKTDGMSAYKISPAGKHYNHFDTFIEIRQLFGLLFDFAIGLLQRVRKNIMRVDACFEDVTTSSSHKPTGNNMSNQTNTL